MNLAMRSARITQCEAHPVVVMFVPCECHQFDLLCMLILFRSMLCADLTS